MTTWTVARSISRPVRERLHRGRFHARVLAVFEHACDLITHDGHVVALVTPSIGDGPLNIVVDGRAPCFTNVTRGAPATLKKERLRVSGLTVYLAGAAVWEPCPDWETLRGRRATIESRLSLLRALCLRQASNGLLVTLLGAPPPGESLNEAFFFRAEKSAQNLREGWGGKMERLHEGVMGLAGLGAGLTPAGDDFLAGGMYWAWLAHPAPAPFCCAMVNAALARTTALSAAFLRAAAQGECSASWRRLLVALSEGGEAEIEMAMNGVLAHGATSGVDSLCGFLFLAT